MPTYYLKSGGGSIGSGSYRGVWVASQTWAVGDRVCSTRSATGARQFKIYECTTLGAGGGSEPAWDSTTGNTTTDNVAVWTCRAATTWANAHMFLDMLSQGDAAGDIIYVSHSHSETSTVDLTTAWAGTAASPTRIICADDTSGEPPTTLATTAVVACTSTGSFAIGSGVSFYYGITFKGGTGSSAFSLRPVNGASNIGYFDQCTFELVTSSAVATIDVGPTGSGISFIGSNCQFKFASTSQSINPSIGERCVLTSCSLAAGSSAITTLFSSIGVGSSIIMSGCDWSGGAAAINLSSSASAGILFIVSDSKLPASWSGSINSSTPGAGSTYSLINCDASDTNYRLQRKTQFGSVTHETTLIRTGGASDGTTGISWKMVSNADAEWSHQTLDTPEIVQWVDSTGSKTATIEILHDSATNLTDKEIWVEVMYLGTSGVPLGSTISDAAANYVASAADQTDSSETWTTTGMSNPNTQKLNVTFTVNEKGFIHAVVRLAKASTTVYVDPKITVS